jgi:PKD repeat protein
MDLLLYCGYTEKLSWITLPYKHPRQLPVADTGEDIGFPENKDDFLRPKYDPRHEDPIFSEDYPQMKEGDLIFLDGRHSYDPQDDVGADGIGYGNPEWTGQDRGEDSENIEDGDGFGGIYEEDLGETDSLRYKWEGETFIEGRPYKLTMTTGWQSDPYYEWKIRLPAMNPELPAEEQYLIVNITLTVMDRDLNQGTHVIQLLAYKSQHKPQVTLTVVPQIPKVYGKQGISYVLPQREITFYGYAFDQDPNSELSFYWEFVGPWNTFTYQDTNIITQSFDEPGDWNITLTVYDGPTDNINTLSGNDTLLLHVVANTDPEPVIRASHNPNFEENIFFYNNISTKKSRIVYFNGSESYDPDIFVEYVNNFGETETYYEGLPGFDEDEDGIPEIPMKYQWSWGDGTRTEGFVANAQAEHKWSERGAAANGKLYWPVILKVWDNDAIVESEPYRIFVNLPPTANAGPNRPTVEEGEFEVGMPVTFNGAKSYDPNDDPNYDQKRDSEYNDRLTYIWDFGDGSAQVYGRKIDHTYESAGTFTVRLTVTDGDYEDDDEALVKIIPANLPPVGVVEITAPGGWEDLDNKMLPTNSVLIFDASGSFDPDGEFYNDDQVSTSPLDDLYGLTWDLGDGTISKQPKLEHIYDEDGIYNVTINMSDRKESIWEETYTITVLNRNPFAVIKLDTALSYYMDEQPVMLSGDGSYDEDGDVVGYYWDFGDGTHSDLTTGIKDGYQPTKVASHQYDSPGDYTVQLLVMDDDFAKSKEPVEVTVRIIANQEPETPFPAEAVIGGIIAAIAIMSVGTSLFAWTRKRS